MSPPRRPHPGTLLPTKARSVHRFTTLVRKVARIAPRIEECADELGLPSRLILALVAHNRQTLEVESDTFRVGEGTLWEGRYLHELYREAATPWEWQPRLRELALAKGIERTFL